jgi:hypothetical protein
MVDHPLGHQIHLNRLSTNRDHVKSTLTACPQTGTTSTSLDAEQPSQQDNDGVRASIEWGSEDANLRLY